ncbi:MAG TPA: hypothetical protein VK933_08775 [Longimicrobiales bacterium]|nr:hypothetical protein [Longimicrobiales bacterium]
MNSWLGSVIEQEQTGTVLRCTQLYSNSTVAIDESEHNFAGLIDIES